MALATRTLAALTFCATATAALIVWNETPPPRPDPTLRSSRASVSSSAVAISTCSRALGNNRRLHPYAGARRRGACPEPGPARITTPSPSLHSISSVTCRRRRIPSGCSRIAVPPRALAGRRFTVHAPAGTSSSGTCVSSSGGSPDQPTHGCEATTRVRAATRSSSPRPCRSMRYHVVSVGRISSTGTDRRRGGPEGEWRAAEPIANAVHRRKCNSPRVRPYRQSTTGRQR